MLACPALVFFSWCLRYFIFGFCCSFLFLHILGNKKYKFFAPQGFRTTLTWQLNSTFLTSAVCLTVIKLHFAAHLNFLITEECLQQVKVSVLVTIASKLEFVSTSRLWNMIVPNAEFSTLFWQCGTYFHWK